MIIKIDGVQALEVGGYITQQDAELAVLNEAVQGVVTREATNPTEVRLLLREGIYPVAGDIESIAGTIADNVGFLLEHIGKLATALSSTADPAVAAAAQPLADALAPLLAGIDDGSVKLTHHIKGTPTIIADACNRATAVATVLESHAAP